MIYWILSGWNQKGCPSDHGFVLEIGQDCFGYPQVIQYDHGNSAVGIRRFWNHVTIGKFYCYVCLTADIQWFPNEPIENKENWAKNCLSEIQTWNSKYRSYLATDFQKTTADPISICCTASGYHWIPHRSLSTSPYLWSNYPTNRFSLPGSIPFLALWKHLPPLPKTAFCWWNRPPVLCWAVRGHPLGGFWNGMSCHRPWLYGWSLGRFMEYPHCKPKKQPLKIPILSSL